jgi:hypothetical protein
MIYVSTKILKVKLILKCQLLISQRKKREPELMVFLKGCLLQEEKKLFLVGVEKKEKN